MVVFISMLALMLPHSVVVADHIAPGINTVLTKPT